MCKLAKMSDLLFVKTVKINCKYNIIKAFLQNTLQRKRP